MLVTGDRIKETSTSTGTGALVLAGAVAGYREVSAAKRIDGSAIADGDQLSYTIVMGTDFESGIAQWNSGADSITRLEVHTSSNAGALVNWSAGTKEILLTVLAKQTTQLPAFPITSDVFLRLSADYSPITHTQGLVDQINDISGNSRHFTATTTARPRLVPAAFNGGPALYFDGTARRLTRASVTLAQPFTILMVLQDYTGGASNDNLYRDSNSGPVGYTGGGNAWAIFAGSALTSTTLYTLNNTLIPTGRTRLPAIRLDLFNNTSSLIGNNGVETSAAAAGTTGITGNFFIGSDGGTSFAKMFLREFTIIARALSAPDRALVYAYYRDLCKLQV